MVELSALWLPVVVSAVFVFFLSSVFHMVLPFHRSDYDRLEDEDAILDALRKQEAGAGNYVAPHCVSPEERKDKQILAKMERGPLAFVTVIPKIAMGPQLASWFVYSLVLGFFVAYVASFTLGAEASYRQVFRLVGTVAFLGYAGCSASDSIWMGRKWSTTARNLLDGLAYGLVTAGVFGWLWPS